MHKHADDVADSSAAHAAAAAVGLQMNRRIARVAPRRRRDQRPQDALHLVEKLQRTSDTRQQHDHV
jgi:hypothetical protein